MNRTKFLSTLLFSVFIVSACQADETAMCQGPLITMSATSEIESLPDVAEVSLNVKSRAKDETTALKNLSRNIEKIIDVLENIEDQSEFKFLYNDDLIGNEKNVNINISNKKVNEILDEVLKGTNSSYSVLENNLIVITPVND